MKKVYVFLLIVSIALAGLVTLVAFNPTWVKIESVELTLSPKSHQKVLFSRIDHALLPKLKRFQGRYFWQVPLQKVRHLVESDRRVLKVDIYREFPSRLKIEIEPHTPVMVFLDRKGQFHPIANDGTLLPASKPDRGMAVLRGHEFEKSTKLREQAIQLFEAIPDHGIFNKQKVSEIFYSASDGFKMFLSGFDSELKIGKTDFGPKLSRVAKVLSYLKSRHIKGRVIDARFSKKVVVRLRNTP